MQKAHGGAENTKKVKFQSFIRQHELLSMLDQETTVEYFNLLQLLVNSMRASEESATDQNMLENILRTLSPKLDYHIAVAIEESNDIEEMKLKSFRVHWKNMSCLKLMSRCVDRTIDEQAFTSTSFKEKVVALVV